MQSVLDNLRNAKALVDTPEKLAGRSAIRVLDDALADYPEVDISEASANLVSVLTALREVDTKNIRSNDRTTHFEIIALFDKAIAVEEAKNEKVE